MVLALLLVFIVTAVYSLVRFLQRLAKARRMQSDAFAVGHMTLKQAIIRDAQRHPQLLRFDAILAVTAGVTGAAFLDIVAGFDT